MSESDLFSSRFRAERESTWRRLEVVLATLQAAKPNQATKAAAAQELPALYQELISSLSVARAISLDRPMIAYLESLASRTALLLSDEQPPLNAQLRRFFTHTWPQTMRAVGWDILLAALIFFAGAGIAVGLFFSDESWYFSFVGWDPRNPDASTEYLAQTLYDTPGRAAERAFEQELTGEAWLDMTAFAAFLFQNNFYVSILALSGGLLFASVTVWVLFFNGLMLGAFLALFASRGLGADVIGWLSIHGVTEIGAILISGGGGLLIGRTMLMVKGQSMAAALRALGPKVAALVLAMLVMLGTAALIEAYLRDTINSMVVRYALGWGLGGLWVLYFALAGHGQGTQGDTARP